MHFYVLGSQVSISGSGLQSGTERGAPGNVCVLSADSWETCHSLSLSSALPPPPPRFSEGVIQGSHEIYRLVLVLCCLQHKLRPQYLVWKKIWVAIKWPNSLMSWCLLEFCRSSMSFSITLFFYIRNWKLFDFFLKKIIFSHFALTKYMCSAVPMNEGGKENRR